MEIHALPPDQLTRFIDRIRKFDIEAHETYFLSLVQSALSELMDFIPCDGALILIDDPMRKERGAAKQEKELFCVAGYGPGFPGVLGKKFLTTGGPLAEAYVLGKSSVRKGDTKEKIVLDRQSYAHSVTTLIGVPIRIEATVVGVMLLINKKDPVGFTIRDLKLLEIFGGYVGTALQNATDSKKAQELSKRDDLTGLFNDRFFHRQLETEIRIAEEVRHPLSLIFMDLDNFKSINDQHGHLVGSQTLKEIGFILREAVNNPKATIARYGGDEYVIILPGVDLLAAADISETIRKMIVEKLFMIDRGEQDGSFINFKGVISCSAGIASLHDHVPSGGSPRERKNHLIRLADHAMYVAKERGKNQYAVAG